MTKQSEYMEAFFGVELHQKFSDMLSELLNIEDDLKTLSKDVAKLGGKLSPDESKELVKESRTAAYELAQQVHDVRDFLDFYLKQDKESVQIVLERDTYMKIYQIFKWDGNDVRDLKNWLRELKDLCAKIGLHMQDLVNFSALTAKPVPEEIAKFPVYAIDRQGYCLTGPDHDVVMYIGEVREAMGLE